MDTPKPFYDKRPWGEELWLTKEKPSMVKIISVNPGESSSLQYHHNRDEYWYILSGNGYAIVDGQEIRLNAGDSCLVKREINSEGDLLLENMSIWHFALQCVL